MATKLKYPVLVAEDFKTEIERGGKVLLELVESTGVSGFAWMVFIVDTNGLKCQLLRKQNITPHEIKSPTALISFAQKFGIVSFPTLPIPILGQFTPRGNDLAARQ